MVGEGMGIYTPTRGTEYPMENGRTTEFYLSYAVFSGLGVSTVSPRRHSPQG